jgi:NACHT domain
VATEVPAQSSKIRKKSWVWVGVGEAVSTILAAVLAFIINILTAERHIRLSVLIGVVALVVLSALVAWGSRAIEARRAVADKRPPDRSLMRSMAHNVTVSGSVMDSPIVIGGGGPVVILNKVDSDSVSVTLGRADTEFLSRPGQNPAVDSGLSDVADQLAASVGIQWKDEANWRHLNDPYAMPITWVPADSALMVPWSALVKLATAGPGWPVAPSSSWASDPTELAGTDNNLLEVLGRVPTGRLVLLGEPGAGKTILLVRLILDLLVRRQRGEAVPILLPMASWNPKRETLYAWMERWLTIDNPALAAPWPGDRRRSRARALLEEGFVLPLLDGLDEMPAPLLGEALTKVNDTLRAGQRLILAARTDAYRIAVGPPGGLEVKLAGAAGIELCALDAGVVAEYLRDSAGGPESAARWDELIVTLADFGSAPVTQALRTPLMAALARAIYNPRPGESLSFVGRHPTELLDTRLFGTREAVERHLFDVFIPAAYRPRMDESRNAKWTSDQAVRWLTFLAKDLQRRQGGTTDLAWWQLVGAAPRMLPALFVGLATATTGALTIPYRGWGVGAICAVAVSFIVRRRIRPGKPSLARGLAGGISGALLAALMALVIFGAGPNNTRLGAFLAGGMSMGIVVAAAGRFPAGLFGGFVGELAVAFYERGAFFDRIRFPIGSPAAHLVNGAALGLAVALAAGIYNRRAPARGMRWSRLGFAVGVAAGLVFGFVIWATAGRTAGLACGAATMCAGGLAGGRYEVATAADTTEATSPSAILTRDRGTFLAAFPLAFAVALALGLGTALSPRDPFNGPYYGLTYGIGIGIADFVAIALALAFYQALWGAFTLNRAWLAGTHRLPLRLMAFLNDAHVNREVLRQVGAIYQFRHSELQRHLASESPLFTRETANRGS